MQDELFDRQWYAVAPSTSARTHKPLRIALHHKLIAVWRLNDGSLAAIDDRCPHLGASLSGGRINDGTLVCPYHGLRFDGQGQCVFNPGWTKSPEIPPALKVRRWHVLDADGWIFIYWGAEDDVPHDMQRFDMARQAASWASASYSVRDWPVHYTRACENSLDVFHFFEVHTPFMPFAMHKEEHLDAEIDGNLLQNITYVNGEPNTVSPGLMYPNLWGQSWGKWGYVSIAFVPIGNEATRIYIRTAVSIARVPVLNKLVSFLANGLWALPLWQDSRVVARQTPHCSDDARDVLLGYDKPIVHYRKFHRQVKRAARERAKLKDHADI